MTVQHSTSKTDSIFFINVEDRKKTEKIKKLNYIKTEGVYKVKYLD